MNSCCTALLFVAHPCHELLLSGWIAETKPVVHVLTDGSGHSSSSRIDVTARFLRETGAHAGSIFGRLSDREAYAMLLDRNADLLLSLSEELASQIANEQPSMVVCDAVEGYNPVHDLCRLIAGAAIQLADVEVPLYEYPVVGSPRAFETLNDGIIVELSEAAHAAKMGRALQMAGLIPDIDALMTRYGADDYRRETFRRVGDWTNAGGETPPLYERLGEERVADHRYNRVIRRAEHILPLRDALRDVVQERSCAF